MIQKLKMSMTPWLLNYILSWLLLINSMAGIQGVMYTQFISIGLLEVDKYIVIETVNKNVTIVRTTNHATMY